MNTHIEKNGQSPSNEPSKPDTPVGGGRYYSPVDLSGTHHYLTTPYWMAYTDVKFSPAGPSAKPQLAYNVSTFSYKYNLQPGPHNLEVQYSHEDQAGPDREESPWYNTGLFYVLTPPAP